MATAAESPPSLEQGRVLLVDDDPSLLKAYRRILQGVGLSTAEAANGEAAVALMGTQPFDVIVSDISMPGMNGIALLRAVRRIDLDVPVILMTGSPSLETAIQAIDLGALRYLLKPIDLPEFRDSVTQAVRFSRLAKLKRQAVELVGQGMNQLGDRAGLEASFDRAISSMWMAFQPIVLTSRNRPFAYEALLRSTEPTLPHPGAVIGAAERLNRLHDLGRTTRALVAQAMPLAPTRFVFVNLHSQDLLDDELYSSRAPLTAFASRVVLEVTERAALEDVKSIEERISSLRKLGFRIAVDDLGAGYAGLTSFAQLQPEVVKFDMSLIRGVNTSPTKQKLIGAMNDLFVEMGLLVVSEGVETVAERDTLLSLRCDLLQGYLYAKPARSFAVPEGLSAPTLEEDDIPLK